MNTKRFLNYVTMFLAALAFAFVTACEGPQGDPGPQGETGAQGEQGAKGDPGDDGTDGVSGSAECLTCHSADAKYLVTQQYEGSTHSAGPNGYPAGRADCQVCHSNEGFIEWIWAGAEGGDSTKNAYSYPTRISCGTCHGWHNESFDPAVSPDYAVRTNSAVDALMYRADDLPAFSYDFENNSNLCANCHQPRRSWDHYLATAVDGNIANGSGHLGPHPSPHAGTVFGENGADVGTTALVQGTTSHANVGCTGCHMYEQDHEMEVTEAACNQTGCHSTMTIEGNTDMAAIDTKLDELEAALITAGLLVEVEGEIEQVTGTFTTEQIGALYNWEWVHYDHSSGIHNYAFVDNLLTKGLEALAPAN